MSSPDWYRPPAADDAITTVTAWQPRPEDTVGFWRRALARAVDNLLIYGVAYAVPFVSGRVRTAGVPFPSLSVTLGQAVVVGLVLSTLSDAMSDAIGGATAGKFLLGMRVRMVDGTMCTVRGALKREVLYLWDALFFAIIAYSSMRRSPLRQRVGDRWGRTIVVHNTAIPEHARASQRAILGALSMVGLYAAYHVLVTIE